MRLLVPAGPIEQVNPRSIRLAGRARHADLARAAARVPAVGRRCADLGGGCGASPTAVSSGSSQPRSPAKPQQPVDGGMKTRSLHARGDRRQLRRQSHLHQRADGVQRHRLRLAAEWSASAAPASAKNSTPSRIVMPRGAVAVLGRQSVAGGAGCRCTGSCRRRPGSSPWREASHRLSTTALIAIACAVGEALRRVRLAAAVATGIGWDDAAAVPARAATVTNAAARSAVAPRRRARPSSA